MNNIEHPHLAFLLSLSLLFPGWAAADFTYDGLVVFGDSLSDSGNKYVVTGLSNTPPYDLLDPFLVPDGPYTKGGLHHSNGKTWVEQYAKPLDLGDLVRPALRNPGKATNYAYGGARARDASATSPNLHLPLQVDSFLADTGGVASPDALHVIFIGGNDIAPDAVFAFVSNPLDGLTIIGEAPRRWQLLINNFRGPPVWPAACHTGSTLATTCRTHSRRLVHHCQLIFQGWMMLSI